VEYIVSDKKEIKLKQLVTKKMDLKHGIGKPMKNSVNGIVKLRPE